MATDAQGDGRSRLDGKVAIVTGGSRGIGRAVAEGFAATGADVVIASRKGDACDAAAAAITRSTGRQAIGVACHVGRWSDCDALVDATYSGSGAATSSSTTPACRRSTVTARR